MNRRLSKRINKKTVEIFIEWLKTVVDESEHEKINSKPSRAEIIGWLIGFGAIFGGFLGMFN